eukprot:SAG11_NODE_2017_length_3918_cov_1.984027_1_plen_259_part_00
MPQPAAMFKSACAPTDQVLDLLNELASRTHTDLRREKKRVGNQPHITTHYPCAFTLRLWKRFRSTRPVASDPSASTTFARLTRRRSRRLRRALPQILTSGPSRSRQQTTHNAEGTRCTWWRYVQNARDARRFRAHPRKSAERVRRAVASVAHLEAGAALQVWGESKRLAVSLRRYNDFYTLREELLAKLAVDGAPQPAARARVRPQKSLCCSYSSANVSCVLRMYGSHIYRLPNVQAWRQKRTRFGGCPSLQSLTWGS